MAAEAGIKKKQARKKGIKEKEEKERYISITVPHLFPNMWKIAEDCWIV